MTIERSAQSSLPMSVFSSFGYRVLSRAVRGWNTLSHAEMKLRCATLADAILAAGVFSATVSCFAAAASDVSSPAEAARSMPATLSNRESRISCNPRFSSSARRSGSCSVSIVVSESVKIVTDFSGRATRRLIALSDDTVTEPVAWAEAANSDSRAAMSSTVQRAASDFSSRPP